MSTALLIVLTFFAYSRSSTADAPCWKIQKDQYNSYTQSHCPELNVICDANGKPSLGTMNGSQAQLQQRFSTWLRTEPGQSMSNDGKFPEEEIFYAPETKRILSLTWDVVLVYPAGLKKPFKDGDPVCVYEGYISNLEIKAWASK